VKPRASWLCPTPNDRERFLDMQERLRPARIVTMLSLTATALIAAYHAGWPMLAAAIATLVVVAVGGAGLQRKARPELWVFATTILWLQLALSAAVIFSGGPGGGAASLLAIPVVMVAARFNNRGLVVGAPVSALLVVLTTVGLDPGYVFGHPQALMVPLTLVLCVAVYVSPLVASDERHRANSTLDQLTGLLNRRALEPRFAEVAEQAALSGQPVSFVLADIDHFKRVNDEHGHVVGDDVLREVAAALRASLRSFELLYRFGGEEFLLLLPGAESDDAADIAESLRAAVAALEPQGLLLTCSFGVATADGAGLRLDALLDAADRALYAAKHGGRNRVVTHAETALVG
jgi:diguanylate cyclase (GGDEF)-like protein